MFAAVRCWLSARACPSWIGLADTVSSSRIKDCFAQRDFHRQHLARYDRHHADRAFVSQIPGRQFLFARRNPDDLEPAIAATGGRESGAPDRHGGARQRALAGRVEDDTGYDTGRARLCA
jgi:hypothetical protein